MDKVILPKFRFIFIIIPFFHFILSKHSILDYQGLYNYLSFLIIYIASYNFFKFHSIPRKIIFVSLCFYFIVAFVQTYINSNFLLGFVYSPFEINLVNGRGVKSLAMEPTYYGFHLLFIGIFLFISSKVNSCHYKKFNLNFNLLSYLLIIISLIFLSKSTSAIATLFICLIVLNLNLKFLYKLILSFPLFGLAIYLTKNINDLRAYQIFNTLIFNTEYLFNDESVYFRIYEPVIALYGSFNNFLFGNGYSDWNYFVNKYFAYENKSVRLTTFIGAIAFETGFINLVLFLYYNLFSSLKKISKILDYNIIAIIFVALLIFIQGITLSYTLVPIILAFVDIKYKEIIHEKDIKTNKNI